jgi:acyl-CoA thioesterase FadM
MKRQEFRFFHRLRVRWAEVDMQKIVFNAHYLMYVDTAVADYWRALALPYEEAMHLLGGDLYVKRPPWNSTRRRGWTIAWTSA